MEIEFVDLAVYRIYATKSKSGEYYLHWNVAHDPTRGTDRLCVELGLDKTTGELLILKQINHDSQRVNEKT